MQTSDTINTRIHQLKSTYWANEQIVSLLGIDLRTEGSLADRIQKWSDRFRARSELTNNQGHHNRNLIELYFSEHDLHTWKWAAVQLGMTEQSLHDTANALRTTTGTFEGDTTISNSLVNTTKTSVLYRQFPAIRNKIFASHSSMCKQLHDCIRTDLEINIEDLRCTTSTRLGEDVDNRGPDFARNFDAITLDPIGTKYQVWLDTGKPIELRPDACATDVYFSFEEVLKEHLYPGSSPRQP